MSNSILTKTSFGGAHSIKRKYKYILNDNKKIIGGFTKKNICNLKGEIVATKPQSTNISINGKTIKSLLYESKLGTIKVIKNEVFLNDELIGIVEEREKVITNIIHAGAVALMLLISLLFVMVIKLPFDEMPNITVYDDEGSWNSEEPVGVLSPSIEPGSIGKYDFILSNDHNIVLKYSFKILEMHNDEIIKNSPIEFRIKMNNILLGNGEWVSSDDIEFSDLYILPESSQMFTLEWRWPFEGQSDDLDTLLGIDGGYIQLVFKLTAESIED